jgi:hypothetical protein
LSISSRSNCEIPPQVQGPQEFWWIVKYHDEITMPVPTDATDAHSGRRPFLRFGAALSGGLTACKTTNTAPVEQVEASALASPLALTVSGCPTRSRSAWWVLGRLRRSAARAHLCRIPMASSHRPRSTSSATMPNRNGFVSDPRPDVGPKSAKR